jgi:hypothetical protein
MQRDAGFVESEELLSSLVLILSSEFNQASNQYHNIQELGVLPLQALRLAKTSALHP